MNSQEGRAGWSESRDVNLTRRALIRAGWIIPAVLVVSLPSKAFAEYSGPQFPADSEAGSLTIGTGGGQGGNSQSSGAQGSGGGVSFSASASGSVSTPQSGGTGASGSQPGQP